MCLKTLFLSPVLQNFTIMTRFSSIGCTSQSRNVCAIFICCAITIYTNIDGLLCFKLKSSPSLWHLLQTSHNFFAQSGPEIYTDCILLLACNFLSHISYPWLQMRPCSDFQWKNGAEILAQILFIPGRCLGSHSPLAFFS